MRILVTGGAGFIGTNLIRRLLKNSWEVICIDNFDDYYSSIVKRNNLSEFTTCNRFKSIEGDIRDKELLAKIKGVDSIIHLAAKPGVRTSFEYADVYESTNVGGTKVLLDFAISNSIKKIVFASSSSVYGSNPDLPWSEKTVPMPIAPYADTKLAAENIGKIYSDLYALQFISLRFFSIYGPYQRPDLAITKFFNAVSSSMPVTLYGDGESTRDFTFVEDAVSAIIKALSYSDSIFEIFNIGSGRNISLLNILQKIGNICDSKPKIVNMPFQLGDAQHTLSNIDKARGMLDYRVTVDIDTGLREFYSWYLRG